MVIIGGKRFIKITEAAQILGVSDSTLRRWDKSGKFSPDKTTGGTRIYDPAMIDVFSGKKNSALGKFPLWLRCTFCDYGEIVGEFANPPEEWQLIKPFHKLRVHLRKSHIKR